MKGWILDRVEEDETGGEAVLEGEDGTFIRVDVKTLTHTAHGSVYQLTPLGYQYDEQATLERKKAMAELTRDFFRRKPQQGE